MVRSALVKLMMASRTKPRALSFEPLRLALARSASPKSMVAWFAPSAVSSELLRSAFARLALVKSMEASLPPEL